MGDMMIPFIMLLIVTIALILERKFQEDKIVEIYEKKLENWKEHTPTVENKKKCKELVGLLFLEDEKLNIEVLDKKIIDKLDRKKYTIKS
ncbi:MAG: hypothetical protein U9N59_02915 [Campylobacterota bacterium]|nr:hypothetical protein [Campylobacterota bacterium]